MTFVKIKFLSRTLLCVAALASYASVHAQTDGLAKEIAGIQHAWEIIQYQTPEKERAAKFGALEDQAHLVTQQFPARAESHTWEGIVLSSWAGAKGGMGALGLAKQAKAEYEAAIAIDPKALKGSALNSLGVLYYKVPGWPIGFGDNAKAEELLKQALALNPDGIDPNYFYADYLAYRKRYSEAQSYLQKALQAPARPGREISDQGRKDDIQKLSTHVQAELRD